MIPTDQWLGLTASGLSVGVREMCCREALHCSFEIARNNLQRISQPGFGLRPQPEPRGVWTVESRSTAATAWGKNMPGVPVDGGLDRWFVRFHTLLALPL